MTLPLSNEYLRSILKYDPDTGIFTWLIRTSIRITVGKTAGSPNKKCGYIEIGIGGIVYRAHRLAWFYVTGKWPPLEIDHKDLDRSNNKWNNLRLATREQNMANRGADKDNTLGVKGVELLPYGRFRARINNLHLGVFDTKGEASDAYRLAATKLYGEFSRAEGGSFGYRG